MYTLQLIQSKFHIPVKILFLYSSRLLYEVQYLYDFRNYGYGLNLKAPVWMRIPKIKKTKNEKNKS